MMKNYLFNNMPGAHPSWTLAVLAVSRKDASNYARGGKFIQEVASGHVEANCGAITEAAAAILRERNQREYDAWDEEKAAILADHQQAAWAAWKALEELFAHVDAMPLADGMGKDLQAIRETTPDDPQTQMAYYLRFIHHHPLIGYQGYLSLHFHSTSPTYREDEAAYLYRKAETLLMVAHLMAHGEIEKARITLG